MKQLITRRKFLKKSGRAGIAISGGLSLHTLLSSCALTLKETKEDIAKINWDCNPILPIPATGCYTGTNDQAPVRYGADRFERDYGIRPAFVATGVGRWGASNDHLPMECREANENGVVPALRYAIIPFEGYRPIIQGKYDDVIKRFAHKVAEFGQTLVMIPFQMPNDANSWWRPWAADYPPGQYQETWVRMHNLFSKEGANKNTIWATKFKTGRWPAFSYPDPFAYCPPKEYIDIIGWIINNHSKPEIGLYSQSFEEFFDYYYRKAVEKFPTKIQAFWELCSANNRSQAGWLDSAFTLIETKYFRVKEVMLDVMNDPGVGDAYGRLDVTNTPESVQVLRKHFTSGHFIGSAIRKY